MIDEPRHGWTHAVLRVGTGRGTVVETERGERFVVTAAHCLPHLPPSDTTFFIGTRTYPMLINRLGAEPSVCADCLFLDPVADLALLGPPRNQGLNDEADRYKALLESTHPLPLGDVPYEREFVRLSDGSTMIGRPQAQSAAWVLSLEGQWFGCRVQSRGTALSIKNLAALIQGGMSGSPIVAPKGEVIGIISTGTDLNPRLSASLPAWTLRALAPDLLTPPFY